MALPETRTRRLFQSDRPQFGTPTVSVVVLCSLKIRGTQRNRKSPAETRHNLNIGIMRVMPTSA
ncbi:hypothetical protein Gal_03967 (plasmid) [Phaeobacter gallaeciensis DSM 26640]|nr:hypothetical protein Gal_01069 [Phaeobacter gallaeciensis DSM 26640]AHD11675.1 hypothetical protein Gal_03967 [Phaeobacter gallaeciensis DSM 26640]ATE92108.1 hypothetical protein PhaeoP11_01064 [Phaeobacter gallaeciensis]ATE94939.1 hypothetical protein PhaeoP11_03953 [Phaeobacter gallaeciensis]